MAGVGNSIDSRDSKEPKIETDSEAKAEIEPPPRGSFFYKGRLLRAALSTDDLECDTQRDLFYKQLEDSEGFDVEWDRFDYVFIVVNFDWNPFIDDNRSNAELMEMLILAAVEEHDEENVESFLWSSFPSYILYFNGSLFLMLILLWFFSHDTKLESVKYMSANIISVKGLLYFITFWATDVLSSDLKPKLYTKQRCPSIVRRSRSLWSG